LRNPSKIAVTGVAAAAAVVAAAVAVAAVVAVVAVLAEVTDPDAEKGLNPPRSAAIRISCGQPSWNLWAITLPRSQSESFTLFAHRHE
jgi:hypothetical protein